MGTAGVRVINENGAQTVLSSSGNSPVKDSAGNCAECCGGCLPDIAFALAALIDGVAFSITADGSCYYESLTFTLVSSDAEKAYFEATQSGDTVYLTSEPVCNLSGGVYDGTIYLLFELTNDVGAPFFSGLTNAVSVSGTTTINDWSWPADLVTDPLFGCDPIPVSPV